MVVVPPPYPPAIVTAYSTVPLLPEVRTSIIHNYNIGSFARFLRPQSVIAITDRPDFHGLPHLDIRLRLDQENRQDPFAIIDETTAASHAIWWVASTDECEFFTDIYTNGDHLPPIAHPGESFTLWQLHIYTQDLPWEYAEWTGGDTDLAEDIMGDDLRRYDPHAPQEPPWKGLANYTKKEDVEEWLPSAVIIASPREWEWSDDPQLRSKFEMNPQGVIRLTKEAAIEIGFESAWRACYHERPEGGQDIEFPARVDWGSPKWPWDAVVAGNKTVATAKRDNAVISCRYSGSATSTLGGNGLRRPGWRRPRPLQRLGIS